MPHEKNHNSPRLYIEADLGPGQIIEPCAEHAHYLLNVMRLKTGDQVRLFNGRDGEWHGGIAMKASKNAKPGKAGKQHVSIEIYRSLRPQNVEPDVWLCCAPIKKAHFDYMIEKATELGAGAIKPILTARTQVREANVERLRTIAIEAAEQSERLGIPAIDEPLALAKQIASWPHDRRMIVCAEHGDAMPVHAAFLQPEMATATKVAIVTGPEGGFSVEELDMLRKVPQALFVRLGPRILRADTAAIATLSIWQSMCGDWKLAVRG